MLSTEVPPYLSCPLEISQLKSSNSCISVDEKVSNDNQHEFEVDLLKPGFVEDNPLPKFSIRDYVSSTRCKDIRTNWPFSQKNLQLCLKHDLTNVLPPFQSIDSVRNPSRMKFVVENTNDNDVRLSVLKNDHYTGYSCNVAEQQAIKVDNINSTESEEEKKIPSPKICSYSDTNSVPLTKRFLEVQVFVNLPKSVVENPEYSVPERNTQSVDKNCKLIVKLHKVAASGISQHLAGNSTGISEIMASKVCPVCKTFSSSSNTTLNAHIDQCLAGVSAVELASNSKASKHRIKPRKTKLMVDIYATAQDLGKRNGTNWSLNFGFPSQDSKVCAENKKIDSVGCINEEGAVYVDSGGAQFLSLSMSSDLPSNLNAEYDYGHRKLSQRNKVNKFSSSKKPKIRGKKYNLSKHPHNRQFFSSRPNYFPEDNYYQHRKRVQKGGYEKSDMAQPSKACNTLESDEKGMVKQWAGSKRTRVKKTNLEYVKHNRDKIVRKLRVKGSFSAHDNSGIKFTRDSKCSDFSDENPSPLPFEYCKRRKNGECNEKESTRKRDGLSSSELQDFYDRRISRSFSQCNVKRVRKDGLSVYEDRTDPVNGADKYELFFQSKNFETKTSPFSNANCSRGNSIIHHKEVVSAACKDIDLSEQPSQQSTTSSSDKKFSSLRKTSTVMRASVPELKERLQKRHFNFHSLPNSDEEVVMPRSALRRQDCEAVIVTENDAHMRNHCGQPSTKRTWVTKLEKGGLVKSGKELYASLKGIETSSESCSDGVRKRADSFTRVGGSKSASTLLDIVKGVEIQGEYIWKRTSKRKDEESLIGSGKSFDSAIHRCSGPSDGDCDSQYHMKAYYKHCPHKLLLDNESEILRADNVFENVVNPETHEVVQLGIDGERGNYFADVDPIPIPGPPGCFLPSPGHMSSEDLQGISSLTTCRISDDKHELVHTDSPNSPISSASMISESAAARSDSMQVNLVEQSHAVQRQNLCNDSDVGINPVIESSSSFEQSGCAKTKLYLDETRGSSILPAMSSQRFENFQPCCCSRKGPFQNGCMSSQDSLMSRRWSIASLKLPVQQQSMGSHVNRKTSYFNFCEEILPEKEQVNPVKVNENSSIGGAPTLVSHDCETNFSNAGDCEFPSPSTSNPVLRLMGKDLMVVKTDENFSPGTRSSSMVCNHPGPMPNVYNSDSAAKSPDEYHFFRHSLSQAPPLLRHVKPDVNSSNFVSLCPHPEEFMPAGVAVGAVHGEADMYTRGSSFGVCTSMAFGQGSRNLNPSFSNQSLSYPLYNGSQTVLTTNFQASSSKEIKTSSIKWSDAAPKD